MKKKLLKHFLAKGYFTHHQQVLVAVSGGLDSMTLLNLLYDWREELGIELGIAHVNHQQRPESTDEENHLRSLAERLQLPIFVAHFSGAFSEEKARDFRYAFFSHIMAEQGYTALVTGHHRDDQVETILMRLLRGSRLRHLSGIKEVQSFGYGQLIRPLLSFSKSDFPDSEHFEDQSNQESTYTRNRVRLEYLPYLRQESPKLDQHLLDLGRESLLLLTALSDLSQGLSATEVSVFRQQTPAVQYFLLQDYLSSFADLALSKAQYQQVLTVLRTKANYRAPLKNGYWLIKDYSHWRIEKINPETDLPQPPIVLNYGEEVVFNDFLIAFSENQESTYLLPDSSALLIRSPLAGDKIQLGHFHKKLSRLFIDDKLPLNDRHKALVIEQHGQIEIVVTSDKTYLRKDPKRDIMRFSVTIVRQGDKDVRAGY
ncbi:MULTISPECIES: tRNA lysidine(34) synthetase TilS [unclassified Streptococcus]|uniref:tRNA lysidine(34) synthetase TilS n=1 Tax=unclassified Streptococcus TaxID=2608887 RepID=UPI00359E23B9